MLNELRAFFTPEAGQARRQWLNEQEQNVGNALRYYLGPAADPLQSAALLAGYMSPGADMMDAADASRAMWNADNPLDAAVAGATMAGAAGMMFLPGNYNALREGFQRTVDDIAAAYDPALVRAGVGPVSETPAQAVARLLNEGRAAEVTDELMARVDPQEMWRLYEAGATGADMPMDLASRMARATDMGFDTQAFHATRSSENFDSFRPGARGSTYFAQTPDGAVRGAMGQALETPEVGQSVRAIIPVNVRSDDVRGLTVNKDIFDALPDVITDESTIASIAPAIRNAGLQYWDDAYEAVPFGDGYRYYKRDAPTQAYQDLEPGRDAFGYRLGAYNSGSDQSSLDAAANIGKQGFMVADEAGSSIVASPNMPIRSQFARFDPRLAHLANLSAGIGGVAVGLNALAPTQENADRQAILDWLDSQGL